MDINDLERQVEALSTDVFLNLTQINIKAEEEINKIFKMLEGSLEIKNSVLDTMEVEFSKLLSAYQTDLKKIETNIQNLYKEKDKGLINLEAKAAELSQAGEKKLKPFFLSQRKKRAELNQKIASYKRELANFHKENNFRLIEEEKNLKGQEAELERRLNIDLKREYEANVKDYSEYEKTLLETNDEQEIALLKDKIKEIRISGIKEFRKILDQYAFMYFEARFAFKNFEEKIILENSLKGEEIKLFVQALEIEKEQLDQDEEIEKQKLIFENMQVLLQAERENIINQNQMQVERKLEILALKIQAIKIDFEKEEKHLSFSRETRSEACEFDLSQLEIYRPISGVFHENLSETYLHLTNFLSKSINLFKENLLFLLQEFLETKKEAHDRFKNLLILQSRGEIPQDGPSFKDILIKITKATEINFRTKKEIFEKVSKEIISEINEIIIKIKNVYQIMSNFQTELKTQDENHYLSLRDLIKGGYRMIEEGVSTPNSSSKNSQIRKLKKTGIALQKDGKQKNIKINKEYNKKLKQLKNKISAFYLEQKAINNQRALADKEFIANSKKRTQELKHNFSGNISLHEKELYSEYQKDLEINLLEEKERISEL